MKPAYTFILLFASLYSFAQSNTFDYVLDIEYQARENQIPTKSKWHVNSKDNTYLLEIKNKNEGITDVRFFDALKVVGQDSYPKNKINASKGLTMDCNKVLYFKNPYKKNQLKRYYFEVFNDTVIDGKAYIHYAIKCNDKKYAKRKKIGEIHYIVHKDGPDIKPVLLHDTAPLTVYMMHKNIPNGLLKERYFITPDGKKECRYKVTGHTETKFMLTAKPCY